MITYRIFFKPLKLHFNCFLPTFTCLCISHLYLLILNPCQTFYEWHRFSFIFCPWSASMLSTEDTSFVKYYCKILYIQGYDKIKSTKWYINRWGDTFLLSRTQTERSCLPQFCKQQQNTTKQTKNPPCKFWVFSHSECRLTMAVTFWTR